jgi:hypothetical protein
MLDYQTDNQAFVVKKGVYTEGSLNFEFLEKIPMTVVENRLRSKNNVVFIFYSSGKVWQNAFIRTNKCV